MEQSWQNDKGKPKIVHVFESEILGSSRNVRLKA